MRIAAPADASAACLRVSDAQRLVELLVTAGQRGTVVFTGAGVSTESGIPDFRSPGGIWSRYSPIGYSDYIQDPEMRRESWRRGLHTYPPLHAAEPNPAHLAIAAWFEAGLVNGVVTQNIDGLHQRAGVRGDAVVELHGNSHWVDCLACGQRFSRMAVHKRVVAGEEDPTCRSCGGMLKSSTVSFGQPLPEAAVTEAQRLHATARLCLVIGSSLTVYPAATLPEVTLEAGGQLAIINYTPTHLDPFAALVSRFAAGQVLAEVSDQLSALNYQSAIRG